MNAYRTYAEVDAQGRLVLEHLPFRQGARVEVLVVDQDPQDRGDVEEWKALFRHFQGLPQSKTVTDADIAQEIADCRHGR